MSTIETELKFDAGIEDDLPSLRGTATVGRREFGLEAVYWDTPDLRLMSWGCTLRHRQASDDSELGWTLKIPAPRATGGADVRIEIDAAGPPRRPPDDLVALLRTFVVSDDLDAVATIVTDRRIVQLSTDGAIPTFELADDRVESFVGGRPGPSFRQIEVEAVGPDAERRLGTVAAQMEDAGFRRSDPASKLERVLGRRPSLLSTPKQLPEGATLREFMRAVISAGTRQLLVNDPGVRCGEDPESIHQARVATRLLRAHLKTFGPLLRRDATDELRRELEWLGELLGSVRDAQVLKERVEGEAASCGGDQQLVDELTTELVDRCERSRELLLNAMDGDRYRRLVADLIDWSIDPRMTSESLGRTPAGATVSRLARREWKRTRRRALLLASDASDEELHDLRKRLKRARYAASAGRRVGAASKAFARQLGDFQDELGDLHDIVVEIEWLETDVDRLGPGAAFLAGRVRQSAAERREQLRSRWWKRRHDLRRLTYD